MSTRKVTLKLTTQKDVVTVETSARTFGELKKELTNISWNGMRVVERASKNTLEMDDAVLPAIDFLLFVVPEKVKSGKNIDVKTANYNELRSYISNLNKLEDAKIKMTGGTEDLRKALTSYLGKGAIANKETANQTVDPIAVIEECRVKINEAIDSIIAAGKFEAPVDNTEYIYKVSVEDLQNELDSIKSTLKL